MEGKERNILFKEIKENQQRTQRHNSLDVGILCMTYIYWCMVKRKVHP